MEEMAREDGGLFFVGAGAVEVIADDGVADAGEVDADLMGAAGTGFDLDEIGIIGEGLQNSIVSDGLSGSAAGLIFVGDNRLASAVAGTGNRCVDSALLRNDMTGDERGVGFVNLAGAKESLERLKRLGSLGNDEKSRGVLVEAMDDSRPKFIRIHVDKLWISCGNPVSDAVGVVGWGWMSENAGRFVDNEEVFVFKKNGDGDVRARLKR